MQATEQQSEKTVLPGSSRDTGGRIKQLLDHYTLSTYQANEKLGYGRSSKLYKLLNNEVRPGYDTLVEILAAFPEVSSTWLLTGAGPMLTAGTDEQAGQLKLVPFGREEARPVLLGRLGAGSQEQLLTVGLDGELNTMLVPVNAQAGYGLQHNEPVYAQQMRQYRLPGFERGTYRAFEVNGDSMEPTLHGRDIVVASLVSELRLLEPGEVYVVVTAENVLLKRINHRLRATDDEVTLYSDNPHRKPFGLETRDIIQLWQVQGFLSSRIPSAPDVTVERLWGVIEALGLDKSEIRRHLEGNAASDATP
ncbi:hypothetical protein HHL22_11825 [Hymenobacter sp. RP-2-7]|uniref:Peptidase S24/S26A/S26B/S26C domain-containing protein n=1 Tax=Hymenobacter polaris TaxID=2682546 RepID=A0A7Y0FMY0_9BACT|nr:S24 family peptidase [Hymenobacter polaris]NML65894.1 hypothetical protein [Hymenobacter polaris]